MLGYLDKNIKDFLLNLRDSISFSDLEGIFNSKELNFFGKDRQICNPLDFKIGKLGNVYLVTAMVAIMNSKPNFVSEIFENPIYNTHGIFGVRIIQQGELKLVIVDDNFPVFNEDKTLALSHTENEIWLPILEKAWAKINGKSMAKALFGTPFEAFNSISFAPTYFYLHKKFTQRGRGDVIWIKILEACARKYAICASTEEVTDIQNTDKNQDEYNEKDNSSFHGNQSYCSQLELNVNNNQISQISKDNTNSYLIDKNFSFTVLDAYEFEDHKIIKFWNPKYKETPEWTGEFHQESEEWTIEMEEYIQYEDEPGIFYASFDEYIKFFAWTYICKTEENFLYRTLRSKEFVYDNKSSIEYNYCNDNYKNFDEKNININNSKYNNKAINDVSKNIDVGNNNNEVIDVKLNFKNDNHYNFYLFIYLNLKFNLLKILIRK
jgi:hypothetical protein